MSITGGLYAPEQGRTALVTGGCGGRYALVLVCAQLALAAGCASPRPAPTAAPARNLPSSQTAKSPAAPLPPPVAILPVKHEAGAGPALVEPSPDKPPGAAEILRPGRLSDSQAASLAPAQLSFRPQERAIRPELIPPGLQIRAAPKPAAKLASATTKGKPTIIAPEAVGAAAAPERSTPIDLPTEDPAA